MRMFVWFVAPLLALALGCAHTEEKMSSGSSSRSRLGTFTRVTMVRRILDGGQTTSGTEVLVVYRDRTAEVRDGDASGAVLGSGTVRSSSYAVLEEALASREWSSLPAQRAGAVPDGPMYTIEVRGSRITRYDAPSDEPIVRRAVGAFKDAWAEVDP